MTREPGAGGADWPHGPALKTGLLGSCAGLAMLMQMGAASADDIEDTRAQLRLLQERLAALETRQDATESVGVMAPAAAVEAGGKPRSWKLPGTNTSMAIGGYAKLDMIYDAGPFIGDSADYTTIPPKGSAGSNRAGSFRAHARQSRLWVGTWTPTDWGELATYMEGDFYGAGGNERVSNSTSFRLRRYFGRLGPVLAGQDWTTFQDISAGADIIDFGTPPGAILARQGQLRYTHVFGGGQTSLAAAIENPESTGLPSGTVGSAGATGIAVDRAPDLTGQLKYKHSKGHVSLRGLLRFAGVDSGGGGNPAVPTGVAVADSTVGWGVGVSGVYKITAKDTTGGEFNYGQGLGRYLANGSTARQGFACSQACATNGSGLQAQTNFGGTLWYRRNWTDTIRTNLAGSYAYNSLATNAIGSAGVLGVPVRIYAVHANVMWSPVPNTDLGFEVNYGNTLLKQQGANDALRFQVGMKYSF